MGEGWVWSICTCNMSTRQPPIYFVTKYVVYSSIFEINIYMTQTFIQLKEVLDFDYYYPSFTQGQIKLHIWKMESEYSFFILLNNYSIIPVHIYVYEQNFLSLRNDQRVPFVMHTILTDPKSWSLDQQTKSR